MRLPLPMVLVFLVPTLALASQVQGTVRDVVSKPLAGATLEVVQGDRVVSRRHLGADGKFALTLGLGRYLLRVSDPSLCLDAEQPLTVEDETDISQDLELSRCVNMTGQAFGRDGNPLAGGSVTLRWYRGAWPPRTVPTDASGHFAFDRIPQGRARIVLEDAAGEELPALAHHLAPRTLELRARPLRLVRAVIRDASGALLPDVDIVLVPERPGSEPPTRWGTDARGRALLPVHTPGRHRVLALWEVEGRFIRHTWRDIELPPGTEDHRVELRFQDHPAAISGRVLGLDGKPVPHAEVVAQQLFPSVPLDDALLRNTAYPRDRVVGATDAAGRFTVRGLSEGEYALTVKSAPRLSQELLVQAGAQALDVRLERDCPEHVTGQIVDERGAPVREFKEGDEEVRDPRGRFDLKGRCDGIRISAEGYLSQHIGLPRPSTRTVDLGKRVLKRARTLTGRVLRPNGMPAADVSVSASRPLELSSRYARTDSSGRFSLDSVPAEEVVLETFTGRADTISRVRIPPGHAGEVTLTLPTTDARLDVRVLLEDGSPLPEVLVTAEGEWGEARQNTDAHGRASLAVPAGVHEVRIAPDPLHSPHLDGSHASYFPTRIQLEARSTAFLELREKRRGTGALRVLLPRWTHYGDVEVFRGTHPWPQSRSAPLAPPSKWIRENVCSDDCGCFYSILSDFTGLEPGTYTVFATNTYGENGREALFRKVIEVDGQKRQIVQVRFAGEDARTPPD